MNNEVLLSSGMYESLLKVGIAVIDARYCKYDIKTDSLKYVVIRIEGDRDDFYLDMLKRYVPGFTTDHDIYDFWNCVLAHKISMSSVLDRDISIKVALIDYLETKC